MCLGTRERTRGSEQRLSTQDTIQRTRQGTELDQTQQSCWHTLARCKTVSGTQYFFFFLKNSAVNSFCLRAMGTAGLFWLMQTVRRFRFPKPEDKVMQYLCRCSCKASLISVTHTGAFGPVYQDAALCKQNPCEKKACGDGTVRD